MSVDHPETHGHDRQGAELQPQLPADENATPRICVIILNYFSSSDTVACLRSLSGAPVNTVYIVDNSADAGAQTEIAQAVNDGMRDGAPDCLLRLSPENLGFSRGVNSAIRADLASKGHDYYLLLNSDAHATPGMVGALLRRIQSEPNCLAVAPAALTRGAIVPGIFWYHRYLGLKLSGPHALSFPVLSGCCLLVSHSAIRDGLLLDERFFMYGEDVELCWRILRAGARVTHDESVFVIHKGSVSSRRGSLFYEYHVTRGHILLATTTWVSRLEIPLIVLAKVVSLLARAVVRTARDLRLSPLAAFVLAWWPVPIRPCRRTPPSRD